MSSFVARMLLPEMLSTACSETLAHGREPEVRARGAVPGDMWLKYRGTLSSLEVLDLSTQELLYLYDN